MAICTWLATTGGKLHHPNLSCIFMHRCVYACMPCVRALCAWLALRALCYVPCVHVLRVCLACLALRVSGAVCALHACRALRVSCAVHALRTCRVPSVHALRACLACRACVPCVHAVRACPACLACVRALRACVRARAFIFEKAASVMGWFIRHGRA